MSLPSLHDITSRFSTSPLPPGVKTPRPPNAWILYRSWKLKSLPPVPRGASRRKQGDASQLISDMWKCEDSGIRDYFHMLAEEASQAHRNAYPGYKFQPVRGVRRTTTETSLRRAKGSSKSKKSKGSRGIGTHESELFTHYAPRPDHPYLHPSSTLQNYTYGIEPTHVLAAPSSGGQGSDSQLFASHKQYKFPQIAPSSVPSWEIPLARNIPYEHPFNVVPGQAFNLSVASAPFGDRTEDNSLNFPRSDIPGAKFFDDKPVERVGEASSQNKAATDFEALFSRGWDMQGYDFGSESDTGLGSYTSSNGQSSTRIAGGGEGNDWDWAQYTHNLERLG